MAAESASAAVVLLSSNFGYSLSTTHVATGSILGSGIGRRGAEVRWSLARRMVTAWLLTLPAAGLVGALAQWSADGIGGIAGTWVVFVVLAACATGFYLRSRRNAVTAANVNAEWSASHKPLLATV